MNSEIDRRLLGSAGLLAFVDYNSASRLQMYGQHISQKLVTANMTERYIQTGMEQEFGKYTFSVKMPCNAYIIAVVPKYQSTLSHKLPFTPMYVVIYEDRDSPTKEIGYLELPLYKSYHTHFGFPYKEQVGMQYMVAGAYVPKDTPILDSPGITADGNYMYGQETNLALMSHPSVSEDGVCVSESFIKRSAFNTYEIKTVEWGKHSFALNIYGNNDVYKIFPDIGEYVRDDSLLMVLRSNNEELYPIRQSAKASRKVNQLFDRRYYSDGVGGRVIDIKVYTNNSKAVLSARNMQLANYIEQTKMFHSEIVKIYKSLLKERKESLSITASFHQLVVESLATTEVDKINIAKQYRKEPLDDYRVEFTIEYTHLPQLGAKSTSTDGGKGVIVHILPDEDMPVDDAGNRADYIMDPNSRINRMNLGGLYEQYINAASRDVGKHIRSMLGIAKGDKQALDKVSSIFEQNNVLFQQAWQYLLGYYKLISPKQYEWATDGSMQTEEMLTELATICQDHVYLYLPQEAAVEYSDAIEQIEKSCYKPFISPVTYRGYSGNVVRTKENVRIGSVYIMLLEKIGDDFSAVASGKVQNYGVLAKLTRDDRSSEPYRAQPIKGVGETEGRIFTCYAGQRAIAEIMDRNNNPAAHAAVVESILGSSTPSKIAFVVDRQAIAYGNTKPLQIVNNIALCGGWKYVYTPDSTIAQMSYKDTSK